MSEQTGQAQSVQRGASEDAAGAPLTPTEVEASRRPPSAPGNRPESTDQDGGAAGGSSGDE